jgi:hypothetical protein
MDQDCNETYNTLVVALKTVLDDDDDGEENEELAELWKE